MYLYKLTPHARYMKQLASKNVKKKKQLTNVMDKRYIYICAPLGEEEQSFSTTTFCRLVRNKISPKMKLINLQFCTCIQTMYSHLETRKFQVSETERKEKGARHGDKYTSTIKSTCWNHLLAQSLQNQHVDNLLTNLTT